MGQAKCATELAYVDDAHISDDLVIGYADGDKCLYVSVTADRYCEVSGTADAALGYDQALALHGVLSQALGLEQRPRRCMAMASIDPPQDCDAPFCGCNPAWSECIEMLQECGWEPPPKASAND